MEAAEINASITGTSSGAYILGRTVKEWVDRQCSPSVRDLEGFYLTTAGEEILDNEMYFVNQHGIWLVE